MYEDGFLNPTYQNGFASFGAWLSARCNELDVLFISWTGWAQNAILSRIFGRPWHAKCFTGKDVAGRDPINQIFD